MPLKTIKQTYKIKAPIGEVWRALVVPKIIDKWGGGPAKMSDKQGFEFKLWGGDIWGKNTEAKPPKLLVQDWTDKRVDKMTKVTFKLSEQGGVTTVDLIHSQVPEDRVKDFSEGWQDYYLGAIKDLLEK